MRIYLDLDGTCLEFVAHFFSYLGLPDHPPTEWDDPRIRENFHRIEADENFWLTMPVKDNNFSFLVAGYITSRPIANEVTVRSLRSHGFPEAPCITLGLGQKKSDHLPEDGILIDDGLHNFHEIVAAGKKCILYTTTYNQDFDTHLRIDSLSELDRLVPKFVEYGS